VKILARFLKDQSGATAIEYALIVGMIFLVIVTAVEIYAQHTNTLYQKIGDAVNNAG
jgi:pilus assembly protein Flp/PilA